MPIQLYLKTLSTILLFIINSPLSAGSDGYPDTPKSFNSAKKAARIIYADNQVSFYCGCAYTGRKTVNAKSCGYQVRKNAKRGANIEWEHIVPAHAFGHSLQCWHDREAFPKCRTKKGKLISGRKCCGRTNPLFKTMESDLHNLVPAVGELNADRSNYSFNMLPGEERRYGACDFEVDSKLRKAEPGPNVQGNIARTYFYFEETYDLNISRKQRQLFKAWNKNDPVDSWECERNRRIHEIQGNNNSYVVKDCK